MRRPKRNCRIAGGIGGVWNALGVVQYLATVTATPETLAESGLDRAEAAALLGLPAWMAASFAVGVFGGLAGCVLLLKPHRAAVPVLALSLLGYLVYFAGNLSEGLFEVLGPSQVWVMSLVVIVALVLFGFARRVLMPLSGR